jgi:ATP-dependent Clp protease ATP-binding subunit ClpA
VSERHPYEDQDSLWAFLAAGGIGLVTAIWKYKQLQENRKKGIEGKDENEHLGSIEPERSQGIESSSQSTSSPSTPLPISSSYLDDISSRDITDLAHRGDIEPIIGREEEIGQMISLLSGEDVTNPLLVGKAGVGKSAIVEGLAQWIAEEEKASALRGCRILEIPVNNLVSGTQLRGGFEERVKRTLQELKQSDGKIIAFFDEIHLLIGAGSGGHSGLDASNILTWTSQNQKGLGLRPIQ